MLIQKIFHVRQSLEETQKRLSEVALHLGALDGVRLSADDDQPPRVELLTGSGFYADLQVEQLPCENPDQTLFRSIDGNVDLTGMLEFFPIREDLTEVQLTVDYALKNPVHPLLDGAVHSVDRFIDRQLRRIKNSLATGVLKPRQPRERRRRLRSAPSQQWQSAF